MMKKKTDKKLIKYLNYTQFEMWRFKINLFILV